MNAEILSSFAGVLLSLAFAYVPGLSAKYDKLESQYKALVMLAALVLVSGGLYGLACADWFSVPLTCDKAGLETLILAFVAALVANQGTYMLGVRPFKSAG